MFDPATGTLPPGVHPATWEEVEDRFGYTLHRHVLLGGLKAALDMLRAAGCRRVYLDGSFVTSKETPGDFDVCWEVDGVDLPRLARMAPVLFDLRPGRAQQKAIYRGELFPVRAAGDFSEKQILEDFQRDQVTGRAKGIIAIDLDAMP